ncbi:MAG: 16S rRNA (uracil(1498)-N(3))-methyltransferase [Rickettsiales bacterium]
MNSPRHRLAVDAPLAAGALVTLEGNPAHYLSHVLRLGVGDTVALFNRADGEWSAHIAAMRKKAVELRVVECLRTAQPGPNLTVCFAPIKGGRLETIIEKATELGARVLQPVITQRTIVTKVNLARADAIAREAAEQCERIDWPEIREPVTLAQLLGNWPAELPLFYGDESGEGVAMTQLINESARPHPEFSQEKIQTSPKGEVFIGQDAALDQPLPWERSKSPFAISGEGVRRWAILAGPEGGFSSEEFAMLRRVKSATGVGLGPRILRADTAIIALCTLTLAAFGDWHQPPRFVDS